MAPGCTLPTNHTSMQCCLSHACASTYATTHAACPAAHHDAHLAAIIYIPYTTSSAAAHTTLTPSLPLTIVTGHSSPAHSHPLATCSPAGAASIQGAQAPPPHTTQHQPTHHTHATHMLPRHSAHTVSSISPSLCVCCACSQAS